MEFGRPFVFPGAIADNRKDRCYGDVISQTDGPSRQQTVAKLAESRFQTGKKEQ